MKQCTHCKSPLPDEAAFCTECGNPLEGRDTGAPSVSGGGETPPAAAPVSHYVPPVSGLSGETPAPASRKQEMLLEIDAAKQYFAGMKWTVKNNIDFRITNCLTEPVFNVELRVEGEVFGEKGEFTRSVYQLKPGAPIKWLFPFKSSFIGQDNLGIFLEYTAGGKRHALSLRGDTVSVFVLEYGRSYNDRSPASIVIHGDVYGSDVGIEMENRRRRQNIREATRTNEPIWQIVELVPGTCRHIEIVSGLRRANRNRIKLVTKEPGLTRKIFVFSGRTLRFGRNGEDSHGVRQDIILRRLPCRKSFCETTDREAYEANMSISRGHGLFLFRENALFVRNAGSKTGISVDGAKVFCHKECPVEDRSIISVASGAVNLEARLFRSASHDRSLKIRREHGAATYMELPKTSAGGMDRLDSVLLKRTRTDSHNGTMHVHDYLFLRGEAVVGTSSECVLRLEGPGVVSRHAVLFVLDGEFFIKLPGTSPVPDLSVDGIPLELQQAAPLVPDCRIRMGEVEIGVGEVEPEDFKDLDH